MGFRNAILLVEDGVDLGVEREAGDVITDLLVEDGVELEAGDVITE